MNFIESRDLNLGVTGLGQLSNHYATLLSPSQQNCNLLREYSTMAKICLWYTFSDHVDVCLHPYSVFRSNWAFFTVVLACCSKIMNSLRPSAMAIFCLLWPLPFLSLPDLSNQGFMYYNNNIQKQSPTPHKYTESRVYRSLFISAPTSFISL